MTDADKLAAYERVLEIVKDQMALEQYRRDSHQSYDEIQLTQVSAYCEIVTLLIKGR